MDAPTCDALCAFLASSVTAHKQRRCDEVLAQRTRYLTVALEDIYQPHNASACLRSCECFGVQDVHLLEGRYRFEANRDVALGAQQWLTLHRYRPTGPDPSTATTAGLAALRDRGYRIVATALRDDAVPLRAVPLDRPVALAFGTEEEGVSPALLNAADAVVRIPMVGFTQSFNISVSVALCLYEMTTRLREERNDWMLSEGERAQLRLAWYTRIAPRGEVLVRDFFRRKSAAAAGTTAAPPAPE